MGSIASLKYFYCMMLESPFDTKTCVAVGQGWKIETYELSDFVGKHFHWADVSVP
jgi:hypothetical protein